MLRSVPAVDMVEDQADHQPRQRLARSLRQRLPSRHRQCPAVLRVGEQIELVCRGLARHGHLLDSPRESPMLRPSPAIAMPRRPRPEAMMPRPAGRKARREAPRGRASLCWLPRRTSKQGLPATGLKHRQRVCSGKLSRPSRPAHGDRPAAAPTDAMDREARVPPACPSCGRSLAAFYNEDRPHGAIGHKPPISLQNPGDAARRSPAV